MIIIRKATQDDLYSIAVVHVESIRTSYREIMPDDYLDNLSYEEKSKSWEIRLFTEACKEFMFVAECSENGVVGFSAANMEKTNDLFERELNTIYLLKEFQRKGIGELLFKEVVSEYRKHDIKSMMLWTLKENPARYFYEYLGGEVFDSKMIDRGGKQLVSIAYGWKDINAI